MNAGAMPTQPGRMAPSGPGPTAGDGNQAVTAPEQPYTS